MDSNALALAQNFATIVGLLCNFWQEHQSQSAANKQEFLEWLQYHRHEEIVELISRNQTALREIEDLLRKNREELLGEIQQLNQRFVRASTSLESFSNLAVSLAPKSSISTQAIHLLKSFANSEFQFLLHWPQTETTKLADHVADFGEILEPTEPRFVEDDLKTLARLGFLELCRDGGCMSFKLTRAGSDFAKGFDA